MRAEANDRSEIVSQLLFGEHFKVLEKAGSWCHIQMHFDGYVGWIDSKQFQEIDRNGFDSLCNSTTVLSGDLVEYLSIRESILMPVVMGSSLAFLHIYDLNTSGYFYDGLRISGQKPKSKVIETASQYLNTPYLWGGKSPFGIDCSGLTQMVYKLNGHFLKRDASEQAMQGEPLSFIEESEPGDLAFFDNEEGKIVHVGIMMENNYIIHASGKVRVDRLDHSGIFNAEINKHTHRLRVIKKII